MIAPPRTYQKSTGMPTKEICDVPSSNGWVEIEAFVPGEPEILVPRAKIICKRGDNI